MRSYKMDYGIVDSLCNIFGWNDGSDNIGDVVKVNKESLQGALIEDLRRCGAGLSGERLADKGRIGLGLKYIEGINKVSAGIGFTTNGDIAILSETDDVPVVANGSSLYLNITNEPADDSGYVIDSVATPSFTANQGNCIFIGSRDTDGVWNPGVTGFAGVNGDTIYPESIEADIINATTALFGDVEVDNLIVKELATVGVLIRSDSLDINTSYGGDGVLDCTTLNTDRYIADDIKASNFTASDTFTVNKISSYTGYDAQIDSPKIETTTKLTVANLDVETSNATISGNGTVDNFDVNGKLNVNGDVNLPNPLGNVDVLTVGGTSKIRMTSEGDLYAVSVSANYDVGIPVGTITMYAGTGDNPNLDPVPPGWVYCNGQSYSSEDTGSNPYRKLFEAIRHTFTDGYPSASFNVPSFNAKFPYCSDESENSKYDDYNGNPITVLFNGEYGSSNVQLKPENVPDHYHGLVSTNNDECDVSGNDTNEYKNVATDSTSTTSGTDTDPNNCDFHNNMPEYICFNFIIKL